MRSSLVLTHSHQREQRNVIDPSHAAPQNMRSGEHSYNTNIPPLRIRQRVHVAVGNGSDKIADEYAEIQKSRHASWQSELWEMRVKVIDNTYISFVWGSPASFEA